jgi:hypothetical protein
VRVVDDDHGGGGGQRGGGKVRTEADAGRAAAAGMADGAAGRSGGELVAGVGVEVHLPTGSILLTDIINDQLYKSQFRFSFCYLRWNLKIY